MILSSCLFSTNLVAAEPEFQNHIELAMYKPIKAKEIRLIQTELDAEEMLQMAESLSTERMSESQKRLAFALIYSAAKKGNAEAQFQLANYYLESDLVMADDNEAAFWLEEAIAQGHHEAKFIYEHLGVADFDVGC